MNSLSPIKPLLQKRLVIMVLLTFIQVYCIAQSGAETVAGQPVQMAEGLRSSGKIYVVVAVLLTVLLGLFLYLFKLDSKISKYEKK